MNQPQLRHFKSEEFREFWDKMNPHLLQCLDNLRDQWGLPIQISPAPGALGRTTGTGYHNYVRHGSVMAVDTMPSGITDTEALARFIELAKSCGFMGIGFYPQWKPSLGIHLDVGGTYDRRWSGVLDAEGDHVYHPLESGVNLWCKMRDENESSATS